MSEENETVVVNEADEAAEDFEGHRDQSAAEGTEDGEDFEGHRADGATEKSSVDR